MNQTAILLSGRLGSWRNSLPSLRDNLARPSEADVFIVTSWKNMLRKAPSTPLVVSSANRLTWHEKGRTIVREERLVTSSEVMEIAELLGPEVLKQILFVEDQSLSDQLTVALNRRKMAEAIKLYQAENRLRRLPPPCSGNDVLPEDAGIGYVVDQYHRVRTCYEAMERHEVQRGARYAYVMRARPDFVVDWSWDIRRYIDDLNALFVCGSVRGNISFDEMEWADDFCWFSGREVAERLFPNLNRMGLITNRKHNTYNTAQKNDYVFAPETQFSLLLYELELPVKGLKIIREGQYTSGGDGYDYLNYLFGNRTGL